MNVLKVYRIVKEKLCVSILMVVTTVVVQLDTHAGDGIQSGYGCIGEVVVMYALYGTRILPRMI